MGWAEWNPVREKKSATNAVRANSDVSSSSSGGVLDEKRPRPQEMKKKEWATIDHLELVASHRSYYEEGGQTCGLYHHVMANKS